MKNASAVVPADPVFFSVAVVILVRLLITSQHTFNWSMCKEAFDLRKKYEETKELSGFIRATRMLVYVGISE